MNTPGPWHADALDGYQRRTLHLGDDPDGEGQVEATLVRRPVARGEEVTGAVLYVHGFCDYFFQRDLADFFAARGQAFYALDLRKCGRSLRPGHTAHYVSDLALYDAELERAVDIVRRETGQRVLLAAHSTGGLVLSLWLDARHKAALAAGGHASDSITGLVLNSPWFDLQGSPFLRTVGTQAIRAVAAARPLEPMKLAPASAYGTSLHVSGAGEWDYDLSLKPIESFPVTYGWLNAVRRGHARLHRGLDVGVPSLVLRSGATKFARTYSEDVDGVDAVLDVAHIARWAGCLGGALTSLPIEGARHDVFLSSDAPRAVAYDALGTWLEQWVLSPSSQRSPA
ncbi:MAG: alpha/beta hydrolase [Nocardioides sp.]|nr:alpha/beta hydrolase [Nocardioides sp.]